MKLTVAALIFGIVFVVVGILGFVPAVTPREMLLGIFHVNTSHNVVHLLTGAVALVCGFAGAGPSKVFFRVFGVLYGFAAIAGFLQSDVHLLGLISNNRADAWLHAAISVLSLILGFAPMREPQRIPANETRKPSPARF